MKVLKVNPDNLEKEVIKEIVEVIKKGGIIVYPTDTVYGLGVNALDRKAVKRVFEIKGRDFKKPVSIIVRDVEMAKKVASFGREIEKILEKILPGPITVILYKKKILSDILTGGSKKIGLRIPDCKFTKVLMEKLDFPITATSANVSGKPASGDIEEIRSSFAKASEDKPDLFLDVGRLSGQASTVIDLTGAKPKILRTGPVTKEELAKYVSPLR